MIDDSINPELPGTGTDGPRDQTSSDDAVLAALSTHGGRLGATATCLREWATGGDPWKATAERSLFVIDVGESHHYGLADSAGSSPYYSGGPPENLKKYAEAFERAAEKTDDPAVADALRVLAGYVRDGRSVPPEAAKRVVERAEDDA